MNIDESQMEGNTESIRWYEDIVIHLDAPVACLQSLQDQNVFLLLIWDAHHKPLEESEEDDTVDPHKLRDLTFQCAL